MSAHVWPAGRRQREMLCLAVLLAGSLATVASIGLAAASSWRELISYDPRLDRTTAGLAGFGLLAAALACLPLSKTDLVLGLRRFAVKWPLPYRFIIGTAVIHGAYQLLMAAGLA